MNSHIKNALLNGRLVLLLGAGSSRNCTNRKGELLPIGDELAKILASAMGEEHEGEELSDVYAAAKDRLGEQLNAVLEATFKHCNPSSEYIELLKYPFFRIYSLNIDDSFEIAAHRHYRGKFNVKQRHDRISEVDQFYETLDYIKLNGDISRVSDGFIFSSQEYGAGSARSPLWYDELARDYHRFTFLFIGTKLKEPLFYHQIEKYKAKTSSSDLKSYILIPSLTSIQKSSLASSNIHHIEGTLKDFTDWLKAEFVNPPTSTDVVLNTRPELKLEQKAQTQYLSVFSDVTPVHRSSLALILKPENRSEIREFYKGFKPTWLDITDEVPAQLSNTNSFYKNFLSLNKPKPLEIYLIFGAAGCGKTTALMQLALKISDEGDRNVYFVEEYKDNFSELVSALDARHDKPYYLVIERIGDVASQIAEIIKQEKSTKAIFISAENSKIWNTRVKEHLDGLLTHSSDFSHIFDGDADLILQKLEKFGNWTRLSGMTPKNRKIELVKKAKKQLLIGLIEATSGEGFNEIIKKDYTRIESESERALLILCGLATTQRVSANEATLTRALSYLNLNPNVHYLASQMDGILVYSNGNVTTRHRVYVERLLNLYVPQKTLIDVINAYIQAFSVYQFPIVKNISRNEGSIYKSLVNAKSLNKLLKNNKESILSVYQNFEKVFENEGLFLMQYGLALRAFEDNDAAYEKLRIAHQAFPESTHIEHALAQQRIILACQESDETLAMSYFTEAESTLNRLNSAKLKVFDLYPIITLSEGHVKLLDHFGHKDNAKIIAKHYHDTLSKNSNYANNHRVRQTINVLRKYYVTGRWEDVSQFYDEEINDVFS